MLFDHTQVFGTHAVVCVPLIITSLQYSLLQAALDVQPTGAVPAADHLLHRAAPGIGTLVRPVDWEPLGVQVVVNVGVPVFAGVLVGTGVGRAG